MERRGELISRQQQRDQTGTLLGMSQQEVAAARDERQMYTNQQAQAFSSAISGIGDAFNTGIEAKAFD